MDDSSSGPAAMPSVPNDRDAVPPTGGAHANERLERRVVAYWLVTELLRSAFVGALVIGGAWFFEQHQPGKLPFPVLRVAIALTALLVVLAIVTPPLAWARWSFAVDDRLLRMRYGILFVEERLVPVPRLQHVDLVRGPIERLFGLATLLVFTAGNEGSAFRVPGLAALRAQELRDRILRTRGHDVL